MENKLILTFSKSWWVWLEKGVRGGVWRGALPTLRAIWAKGARFRPNHPPEAFRLRRRLRRAYSTQILVICTIQSASLPVSRWAPCSPLRSRTLRRLLRRSSLIRVAASSSLISTQPSPSTTPRHQLLLPTLPQPLSLTPNFFHPPTLRIA